MRIKHFSTRIIAFLIAVVMLLSAASILGACKKAPAESETYLIAEDTVFPIDLANSSLMGLPFSLVIDSSSCITLRADGTATINIKTTRALSGIVNAAIGGGLASDFILTPFIEMALEYIPGFDLFDMERTFNLVNACLGLSLIGFDWDDPEVEAMFAAISETGKLPDSLELPKSLTLEYNADYHLKDVTSPYTGNYTGVFMGDYAENGEPFILLDLSKSDGDIQKLNLRIELVKLIVNATEA